MRILFITSKYPPCPCGVGDHTCGLARELRTCGHEIMVYTSSAGKSNGAEDPGGVRVLREICAWDFSANFGVLESARRHRAEIVHLQYTASWHNHPVFPLFPWAIKRRACPPVPKVVVTLHELEAPITKILPGPTRRAWLIPLLLFSDAIIVTSERDASVLRRIPFMSGKLHYIPLGSNLHQGTPPPIDRQQIRKQLGVRDDETLLARFGFVDNIQVALIPMVLHSVRQLLDRGCRVKLLLVGGGSGPGQTEVLKLARELGIENHLLFTGYRPSDEASRYLRSADIAVQPYPEGVCERRSSLQAVMALGLPIVSTQRGIPLSLFRPRDNVMLARVHDSRKMADAIGELISDPSLRARLAEGARISARLFSWDKIARDTERLYQSLCEPPRR